MEEGDGTARFRAEMDLDHHLNQGFQPQSLRTAGRHLNEWGRMDRRKIGRTCVMINDVTLGLRELWGGRGKELTPASEEKPSSPISTPPGRKAAQFWQLF